MRYLVIYDISNDRVRQRVADACLDYGLERIQDSAFCGELNSVHQRELLVVVRDRVGKAQCNIQMIVLDKAAWEKRRRIEQGGGND